MKTIDPNPDRFAELQEELPQGQPVVMLNLLRFREQADYKNGEPACSGREAYRRYGEKAVAHLQGVGAKLVWHGNAKASVIAPPDEQWDEILLVRYPSVEKFVEMVTDPDYRELAKHRTAALEDARLVASLENT
ncbi:DUF1330 domain-containing protein [Microbulbifer halophilus]|uniref:DUF1330 domain-containing protein n=1 Tax=Microbulbifer halophilus TaxID=453963 RepID=A0ABW5ECC2_9GAMM|nr:DUF1330 domain-containing protein [Microbulbifer halophilus]MCW8126177.1 DUF1330 domain-containing protein [Microbulbifer halophilus]